MAEDDWAGWKLLSERLKDYSGRGLSQDLIWKLLLSPRLEDFEALLSEDGTDAVLAADLLVNCLPSLKRKGYPVDTISREQLRLLLDERRRGRLVRAAVKDLLAEALSEGQDLSALLEGKRRSGRNETELRRLALEIAEKERARVSSSLPEACRRFLMGRIMSRLRYDIEGRQAAEWLAAHPDDEESHVRRPV